MIKCDRRDVMVERSVQWAVACFIIMVCVRRIMF